MPDLPSGALEVANGIGRIAASATPVRERAAALLATLGTLFPFEGSAIAGLDTDLSEFVSLAGSGYDQRTREYYASPHFYHEIDLLGLTRNRAPMRVQDLPVPPSQVRVWADYLAPAGFWEGLALPLIAPDGRHVGLVGLHSRAPELPVEIRDFLGRLAPTIANAIDPLRSIAPLALMVTGARAGVLLTRAGHCLPLPGLPGDPLLRPDSLAVSAAKSLADDQVHVSFLAPSGEGYARLSVLACPPDAPRHLRSVLLLSPPGDLHGLTRRELEVLGLLVQGWANQRIATTLTVSERTVATHLEHILAKLAVPSRTLAAIRALRLGLYLPGPGNDAPR